MVERVPCSVCGNLILPSTAEKTGGLCMPCNGATAEVLPLNADKLAIEFKVIMSLMNKDLFEEAEDSLNYLLRAKYAPHISALLHLRRGQCRLNLDEKQEAIRDFTSCIQQEAAMSEESQSEITQQAFLGRSVAQMPSDLESALNDINSALRLNPNDYWALFGRAIIRAKWNDRKGALEDLEYASTLSLNRSDAAAYKRFRDQIDTIRLADNVREFAGDVVKGIFKRVLTSG